MTILSDAFDGFIDFVSGGSSSSTDGSFTAPGASAPGPYAPSYPSDSLPSLNTVGKIVSPLLQLGAPLIKASVTRPKVPARPVFPEVPDSVKNDPRVQNLLGSYGFTNGTMPTIQQPTAPSAFQIAFPTLYNTAASIFGSASAAVTPGLPKPQVPAPVQAPPATAVQTQPTVVQAQAEAGATLVSTALPKPLTAESITQSINATNKYDPLITQAAKANGIDPNLVRAVVQQESGGDTNAVGDGGKAIGLGQMHAAAAQDANGGKPVSPQDLSDPTVAIPLIAKHLATLNQAFGGNEGDPSYEKTISAYNAGHDGSLNPQVYNSPHVTNYRNMTKRRFAANQQFYDSSQTL